MYNTKKLKQYLTQMSIVFSMKGQAPTICQEPCDVTLRKTFDEFIEALTTLDKNTETIISILREKNRLSETMLSNLTPHYSLEAIANLCEETKRQEALISILTDFTKLQEQEGVKFWKRKLREEFEAAIFKIFQLRFDELREKVKSKGQLYSFHKKPIIQICLTALYRAEMYHLNDHRLVQCRQTALILEKLLTSNFTKLQDIEMAMFFTAKTSTLRKFLEHESSIRKTINAFLENPQHQEIRVFLETTAKMSDLQLFLTNPHIFKMMFSFVEESRKYWFNTETLPELLGEKLILLKKELIKYECSAESCFNAISNLFEQVKNKEQLIPLLDEIIAFTASYKRNQTEEWDERLFNKCQQIIGNMFELLLQELWTQADSSPMKKETIEPSMQLCLRGFTRGVSLHDRFYKKNKKEACKTTMDNIQQFIKSDFLPVADPANPIHRRIANFWESISNIPELGLYYCAHPYSVAVIASYCQTHQAELQNIQQTGLPNNQVSFLQLLD